MMGCEGTQCISQPHTVPAPSTPSKSTSCFLRLLSRKESPGCRHWQVIPCHFRHDKGLCVAETGTGCSRLGICSRDRHRLVSGGDHKFRVGDDVLGLVVTVVVSILTVVLPILTVVLPHTSISNCDLKICDFGLARLDEDTNPSTMTVRLSLARTPLSNAASPAFGVASYPRHCSVTLS